MKEVEHFDWGNEDLFQHEVDAQATWKKINSQLTKRKKKRRFIFWLVIPVGLGFLGLFTYFLTKGISQIENYSNSNEITIRNSDLIKDYLQSFENLSAHQVKSKEIITSNKQIRQSNVKQNKTLSSAVNETITKTKSTTIIYENSNKTICSGESKANNDSSITTSEFKYNSRIASYDDKVSNNGTISKIDDIYSTGKLNKNIEEKQFKAFEQKNSDNLFLVNGISMLEPLANNIYPLIGKKQRIQYILPPLLLKPKQHKFSFKPELIEFSVAYGIMNYNQDINNSESTHWATQRKQQEKPFDAMKYRLMFHKPLNTKYTFYAGVAATIEHTRVNERGTASENIVKVGEVVEVYKTEDNIDKEIRADVNKTVTHNFNNNYFNSYQQYSVQTGISRRIHTNKVGNWDIKLGINLLTYNHVNALVQDKMALYSHLELADYRRNLSIINAFCVSVAHPIYVSNNLILNPFIEMNQDLAGRFTNFEINQKHSNYLAGLGLYYKLKTK